ncbi:MAG: DUF4149 domain-containing protein [Calditrichaeota bacterium]|nr:MAG: DUF4149 domain-containing protein [Calditrichota bacterium]
MLACPGRGSEMLDAGFWILVGAERRSRYSREFWPAPATGRGWSAAEIPIQSGILETGFGTFGTAWGELVKLVYLFSVLIHLVAAMVWIGGMLFLAFVIVPVIRKPEYQSWAARVLHQTGERYRAVGWIALSVFVITGLFNLFYRLGDFTVLFHPEFWAGPFGQALGIKLVLFGIILLVSAIHDFYIGPRATELWQADPNSPQTKQLRRTASWFGRINLLLGVIVVFLAIIMVRGWP